MPDVYGKKLFATVMKYRNVLVIRNSALGDVAMTLPVLYSVARQYPDVQFHLLTRPFFARIFINRPDNLHIIEADLKATHKGTKGLVRLITELRHYHFDAVADLHNVLRSWIIDTAMRISGARVAMVDKKRASRIGKSRHKQQRNFIDRYADVFNRLGMPVTLDFHSLYNGNAPDTPIHVDRPAVGIAPFARYINKTYPLHKMQQVVEELDCHGVHVYLFGARGTEASILEGWADKLQHCTCVAGKTDIVGELALMHRIGLMLTMDSANHHLASIAGARVISIWGSTTPLCGFNGYNQSPDDALCAGLECQPCTVAGSRECRLGTMACMTLLKPQDIVNKILGILNIK